MRTIYEAHVGMTVRDFDDKAEAMAWVEAAGHGYVVTFYRGYDGKDRSGAMQVYGDGAWKGVDISR